MFKKTKMCLQSGCNDLCVQTSFIFFAFKCVLQEKFIFSVKLQSAVCCKFLITCTMIFLSPSSITNKETFLFVYFHIPITTLTKEVPHCCVWLAIGILCCGNKYLKGETNLQKSNYLMVGFVNERPKAIKEHC